MSRFRPPKDWERDAGGAVSLDGSSPRASRSLALSDEGTCVCHSTFPDVTFRDGEVVSVLIRHRRDLGCGHLHEPITVDDWLAVIPIREA